MTTPYPINELFVWIVDDPTGQHAIMGVMTPGGLPMQAVSSKRGNMARAAIRDVAWGIAQDSGCTVKLQRFVLSETIEEMVPEK